jgi:hypothetical protein
VPAPLCSHFVTKPLSKFNFAIYWRTGQVPLFAFSSMSARTLRSGPVVKLPANTRSLTLSFDEADAFDEQLSADDVNNLSYMEDSPRFTVPSLSRRKPLRSDDLVYTGFSSCTPADAMRALRLNEEEYATMLKRLEPIDELINKAKISCSQKQFDRIRGIVTTKPLWTEGGRKNEKYKEKMLHLIVYELLKLEDTRVRARTACALPSHPHTQTDTHTNTHTQTTHVHAHMCLRAYYCKTGSAVLS